MKYPKSSFYIIVLDHLKKRFIILYFHLSFFIKLMNIIIILSEICLNSFYLSSHDLFGLGRRHLEWRRQTKINSGRLKKISRQCSTNKILIQTHNLKSAQLIWLCDLSMMIISNVLSYTKHNSLANTLFLHVHSKRNKQITLLALNILYQFITYF